MVRKNKKTVIIFGISSVVGSNLAEYLKNYYKVIGTYYSTPVSIPGILTIPCDVLVKDDVQLAMFLSKADYAIYAVGVSSLYRSHEDERVAEALNTMGVFNVTEFCQRYKAQFVLISSAYVFSGENKDYLEMDIPDANTIYGKTKASAEFFVQKTSLNYLIFRTSFLYGRGFDILKLSWFETLQNKILSGSNYACDDYILLGFLDIYYLGIIIKLCFEMNTINRMFQVSSQDCMTYYEFAKTYCKIFGDADLISKRKWEFPISIAAATSVFSQSSEYWFKLNVLNLESSLNINLPTIEESLKFTFSRLGGRDRENQKTKHSAEINYI